MIPFASQRGGGQDLATHLQNDLDNDFMEVAELRGAIAGDLHGAFAEWKLQADCLTRCRNYLYSLSINPWEKVNGPMTRDQYVEYIDRVEDRLGLSGQPRALVFHIKDGREHAHVVWSRINVKEEKAIQMSFDHDTLMMVTREFARDHGLELPDGYQKNRNGKNRQSSLYEQHQQRDTGLTKEEKMNQITDAWAMSDSPAAFVTALSEAGYILATGNRPYVLVDLYGHMNALPRMIDDKTVRAKDVQAFLEKDFPPDSLPTIDEARDFAAAHRKKIELHKNIDRQADRRDQLKMAHVERRKSLERESEVLRGKQQTERKTLNGKQADEKETLKQKFAVQEKAVLEKRAEHRPVGLAAFLGRVSGMELVRKKLHQYQDKKRLNQFSQEKLELAEDHRDQSLEQQRVHEMLGLDMNRKVRNLTKIEKREFASLEAAFRKERNLGLRAGHEHMPSFGLDLSPPGRKAQVERAINRYRSTIIGKTLELGKADEVRKGPPDLTREFDRAAEDEDGRGERDGGDDRDIRPRGRSRNQRNGKSRRRDNTKDRGQGR